MREVLPLDSLVTDAGTQVRSGIDDGLVGDYADALLGGARFPPIVVFRGEEVDLLSDGFHRVEAYRKAGRSEIEADVHHGTREDALWFALGANRAHGHRLTRADKRRAIEIAYRSWPDLSQVRIAGHVGCSQQYVSQVRSQLTTTCKLPDRVVGVDGRSRPATRSASPSRAGSSSSSDAPLVSTPPAPEAAGSDLRPDDTEPVGPAANPTPSEPPADECDESPGAEPPPSSPAQGGSPAPSASPPVEVRRGTTASQAVRDRSNRIVSVIAYDAKNSTVQQDLIEFSALDHDKVPGWIDDIEEGCRNLGHLTRRLRQELANGSGSPSVED